jgi:hypothetical protein
MGVPNSVVGPLSKAVRVGIAALWVASVGCGGSHAGSSADAGPGADTGSGGDARSGHDAGKCVNEGGGGGDGASDTGPNPAGATVWKSLAIGAGGWLTGLDIAPDATMIVRTDTYGAYIWSGTQWSQLVTANSMPAALAVPGNNAGVYEIRIAPSNSSRIYMAYLGLVYRSDDKGTTFTQTAFASVTMNANDDYRIDGQKMAVDPANPDVVYFGTSQNGLFVTSDGGSSWQLVTGIATGTVAGYPGIAFDPKSGTTGGKTNTLYVPSWGNGVWQSTNAGASWNQLAGGPTTVNHAVVSADGIYYAADGTAAWKYTGGAWTNMNSASGWHTIVSDPLNPARLITGDGGGNMNQSLDHGSTWTGVYSSTSPAPGISRVATDVPWLAWTDETYMSNGDMAFDPVSMKLYFSEGIGVWQTDFPSTYVGFAWTSQSAGIEQLVSNYVTAPPGGRPVVASWDRALFYSSGPGVYPSQHGVNNTHSIVAGWDVDYAAATPTFLAAVVDWNEFDAVEQSAYSTNGGQTWTQFASYPTWPNPPMGGCIAVSTPQNIVWVTSGAQNPYFTQDGGKTWQAISLPGVTSWAGLHDDYYYDRHIVAPDRVTSGTFYLYDSSQGLFTSTDGGMTWTLTFTGEIAPSSVYNATLKSVPGQAGHLFFTSGQLSGSTPSGPFMHSTDGGKTWMPVPNVIEVYAFGLGKEAPTGTYPTIFIVGYVGGAYGIWRSIDEGGTWTQIGEWPMGSLDEIKTVEGDKDVYGTVYVGFSGSGYGYGALD